MMKLPGDFIWNVISFLLGAWFSIFIVVLVYPHINSNSNLNKTVQPKLNITEETIDLKTDSSVTQGNLTPDVTVHPQLNITQESTTLKSDPSLTLGNLLLGETTVHPKLNILKETGCSEDDFAGKTNETTNKDYLWRISRNDLTHESYLFGTIHVPARIVLSSLSEKTREAFKKSDGIFIEIESSSEFESRMAECDYLPLGTRLDHIFSEELISRLKVYFNWLEQNYGISVNDWLWRKFYPSDLAAFLEQVSDSILFPKTSSYRPKTTCVSEDLLLDNYLEVFGEKLGKITGGVETAEDRCQYKRDLPYRLGAFSVESTLLELEIFMNENKREFLNDILIDIYNKKSLNADILDSFNTTEFDNFLYSEGLERNKKMTVRMIEIMTGSPDARYFFAFGVAHFFGDGSVNELLEENGFTVQRL